MAISDWLSKGEKKPAEGAGDAHPLSSEAGIRALQQQICASLPAAQLDYLCTSLESAVDANLGPAEMRRALRMLDAGAQKPIAELQQSMLRDARGGQVPELTAAAIVKYCRRLCALCERALDAPPEDTMTVQGPGSDALLALRAMRAWVLRKKILRMSYRFPDEEFWNEGNRLHTLARARGFLLAEIEPYGPGERSSVTRERLAGLIFDMAPNASLTPPQMECLDLLLRQYVGNFLERDTPAPEAPFYYDQARPQPPQRWLPGLPPRSTMRFFGPGDAAAKIAALAETAARADTLPPWAAASGCDADAYAMMLQMLAKHWSDKPPQRRDRRTAASANVLIVNGIEDTRRAVAASEEALKLQREGGAELKGEPMRDDKYFDRIRFGSVNPDKTSTGKLLRKQLIMPKDVLEKRERGEGRPAPESSAISDTSETGIGIALPGRAPWAKVGVLVGYREPDSLQWQVAIVRRLVRGARLSIGLERLRGDAASARVVAVADTKMETLTAAAQSKLGMREAILMGEPSNVLIGEPAALAMGQTYAVFLGESVFPCTLRKIREQGGEFVVTEFDKTSA